MHKRIVIDGDLEAHSAYGAVRFGTVDGVLRIDVSNARTLAALFPASRMKLALSKRSLAGFIDQPIELRVADKLWLTVQQGQITYHRPFRLATFALGQLIG